LPLNFLTRDQSRTGPSINITMRFDTKGDSLETMHQTISCRSIVCTGRDRLAACATKQ
jgi:hypothetical protein